MHRLPLRSVWHRSCSRIILQRRYASFNNSIDLQPHEVLRIENQPLPGVTCISLETSTTWPEWDTCINTKTEQDLSNLHNQCKLELTKVFDTLQRVPTVTKVQLSLQDVLKLPVMQPEYDREKTHHNRSPKSILEALDIQSQCDDLCLWTSKQLSTLEIIDRPTRTACLLARSFDDAVSGDGRDAWRQRVEKAQDRLLYAYDYTAGFHARDLVASDAKADLIDLRPFATGVSRIEGVNLDEFSVAFAQDLRNNIEYFAEHPWRSDIYEQLRDEYRFVTSNLLATVDAVAMEPVHIILDRPVWQIDEKMRSRLIARLNVKDDEEVYFEERAICKRKKSCET